MNGYECEVETPDGTVFVLRGPDAPMVAAQAARLPAIHEKNRRQREVDLPPERWRDPERLRRREGDP